MQIHHLLGLMVIRENTCRDPEIQYLTMPIKNTVVNSCEKACHVISQEGSQGKAALQSLYWFTRGLFHVSFFNSIHRTGNLTVG